jgi:6-phosphogluconolactonase (cycloisomerase 2 family)
MTLKARILLVSTVLAATTWLGGCGHYVCDHTFGSATCTSSGSGFQQGGGTGTIAVTTFVYFADPAASQMSMEALNIGNSQTFAPVSTFVSPSVVLSADFVSMAVVGEQYLYLSSDGGTLYGFAINSTSGALTAVPNSPYSVSGDSIAADPNGHFLFVGNPSGIYVYTVNSDGSLTLAPGSPFSNGGIFPTQLITDGLGKYLYAVGGTTVSEFSYNQTSGVLTTVGTITPGLSVIASEKTGTYILGITGTTADVHVYGIGSAGALTELSNSPSLTTLAPVYLAVDSSGTYVYTFNQTSYGSEATSQPMEGYLLATTGSLTAVTGSPFTGLDASYGLIDQSGQYIFVEAQAGSIAEEFAYGVDTSTGAVTSTLPSAGIAGTYVVTDVP